jgi:hypothetical protein
VKTAFPVCCQKLAKLWKRQKFFAEVLLKNGLKGYRAYICQNLGGEGEEVVETDLHHNILILVRGSALERRLRR